MKVTRFKQTRPLMCVSMLCMTVPAFAVDRMQVSQQMTPEQCSALALNHERLGCYDAIFKHNNVSAVLSVQPADDSLRDRANTVEFSAGYQDSAEVEQAQPLQVAQTQKASLLDKRWELTPETKKGTWRFSPYQPMYALPLFWTSKKNEEPSSPNPRNDVTASEREDLNSVESKFQISMKTKALENIFGNNGDLWLGYTQMSHWQVYNSDESRPFHAVNYEPEAMLMFRTNYNVLGLNGRLLGIGFNHQSNGSSDPFSRSWNRVMFNIGFERDNFVLMIRPWIRIPEKSNDDDNPNITKYMGKGDITAFYNWRKQQFSLMLRHNLKTGSDAHGAVQFDWAFPITGNLKGHFQLFDGYGESLIDYNHRATYVGLGVSLMNWY
jgi:phospholipase A1/A2